MMKNPTLASMLLTAVLFVMSTLPALAADEGLWLTLSDDKRELEFNFSDPSQDGEVLGFTLDCGKQYAGGPELAIIGDENSAKVAKLLPDTDPFGDPAAIFRLGSGDVKAPVWGYQVDMDELNGTWDLTLKFGDPNSDLLSQIAAKAKQGGVVLKIAGSAFDLTPRAQHRALFLSFLSACGH